MKRRKILRWVVIFTFISLFYFSNIKADEKTPAEISWQIDQLYKETVDFYQRGRYAETEYMLRKIIRILKSDPYTDNWRKACRIYPTLETVTEMLKQVEQDRLELEQRHKQKLDRLKEKQAKKQFREEKARQQELVLKAAENKLAEKQKLIEEKLPEKPLRKEAKKAGAKAQPKLKSEPERKRQEKERAIEQEKAAQLKQLAQATAEKQEQQKLAIEKKIQEKYRLLEEKTQENLLREQVKKAKEEARLKQIAEEKARKEEQRRLLAEKRFRKELAQKEEKLKAAQEELSRQKEEQHKLELELKLEKEAREEEKVSQKAVEIEAPEQISEKEAPLVEYFIAAEDEMEVFVWQYPDLTKTVIVAPDGWISYPLIGRMRVASLSASQLEDKLREKLSQYIKYPQVSVMMKKFAGHKIIILGEITYPGIHTYKGPINLIEAIAIAGDFTGGARRDSVIVVRGNLTEKPEVKRINMAKVIAKGTSDTNIVLKPNDVIYVPTAFISDFNKFLGNIMPTVDAATEMLGLRREIRGLRDE